MKNNVKNTRKAFDFIDVDGKYGVLNGCATGLPLTKGTISTIDRCCATILEQHSWSISENKDRYGRKTKPYAMVLTMPDRMWYTPLIDMAMVPYDKL